MLRPICALPTARLLAKRGRVHGALAVWMHTDLAAKLGLQIGDQFDLRSNSDKADIPIQMAGFWRAANPKDSTFWFSEPDSTLRDKLLVRRADYIALVEPKFKIKVRSATWYVILDDQQTLPANARQYISGFERGGGIIKSYLPDAQLTTPTLSLGKFVGRQTTLTTLLLGFNIPAFGFLLYFLVLTSAVIAYWSRRESAILISRGMTRWGVLSFTVAEGLLLGLLALPLGLGLGVVLARLMGNTVSFLTFQPRTPLPVAVAGLNWPAIGATLALIMLARLWMAFLTSRDTVLSQEREHIRPPRGPFWYRAYLDFFLLIPTWYGYQQLLQRGSLGALVRDRAEDLYQDPLLIIVPALFVVVAALLAMRLFPWVMRLLDLLAARSPWLTSHLALRQLGRYSQNYINPMILVIVSLALGVYTLSMAASLDQWLTDRVHYRTGADLTFEPFSDANPSTSAEGAAWVPPVSEFAALPGVMAAARVGNFSANLYLTAGEGNNIDGRFLGIDRVDLPKVAWFRRDFASESLGAMMNRLAILPEGILVSEQFLGEHGLHVGDRIDILVLTNFGASLRTDFTVVGAYRYFPTIYEAEQVKVIGNLDYLESLMGLTMPHDLWLRLRPGADRQSGVASRRNHGCWHHSRAGYRRHSRQGTGPDGAGGGLWHAHRGLFTPPPSWLRWGYSPTAMHR